MKKYFNFMLFTIAALLFTGCSNEEEIIGGIDKADPQGKIGFSFPMNGEGVTYAGTLADGAVGVANANESVVKSVRIYMFKTADNKLIDWQVFSEADMAANGGKALFDVTGATSGATFYAVANADFHIPAASLNSLVKGTTTLTQFKQIISNNTGKTHLKAEADKGLLMAGYQDVANVLAPTAAEKKINLKRRVARFDVVNKESDGTLENLGGSNFKISAIYVSKANYAGYITAEGNTGATLPTPGSLDALTYNGTNDGAENKSVFYLWPTTLDALQAKTVISIEGTFNGVKQVYQVKPAADINIQGNYRYTLSVKRVNLSKIDFEIKVDLWNDGGVVNGEQDKTPTKFSALTMSGGVGGTFLATMDGTVTNYEGSDATGTATLQFTTTSYRSDVTDYSVTNYNGTENGGTDIVITKDETVTYAGAGFVTTYKITIPKQTSPVDRKITITDANDVNSTKVIIIKANPKYLTTTYKPVLFGGKYWAPLNVGATKIDATTLDQASMGNVYQWGRSYASLTKASGLLGGDELAGPVSVANATTGTHKDKFILAPNTPYNWLKVDGTLTTQEQADALWSGANDQGPCPTGWRLPTKDELALIQKAYSTDKLVANRLAIPGENADETLYLPAAGYRIGTYGASFNQGTSGYYWSSNFSGANVSRLRFSATGSDTSGAERAYGFSVRCVQK